MKKILVKKIHKQIKKKNQIYNSVSYNKIKRKSLRLTTRIIVVKMNKKVKMLLISQNKIQNNNLLNNKIRKNKKISKV